jgi:hypothetical protein
MNRPTFATSLLLLAELVEAPRARTGWPARRSGLAYESAFPNSGKTPGEGRGLRFIWPDAPGARHSENGFCLSYKMLRTEVDTRF